MSPVVHVLVAWLIAMLFLKHSRDRRIAVICGFISDVDGFYLLFDTHLFYLYHHTWGHSYLFIIPLAIILAWAKATDRPRIIVTSLVTFTAHLVCDIVGSNWPVHPLYPYSEWMVPKEPLMSNTTIYLVVNPIVAALVLLLVFLVMIRTETSPMEFFGQEFDRKIVNLLIAPFRYRCSTCDARAFTCCDECQIHLCQRHCEGRGWFGLTCGDCAE